MKIKHLVGIMLAGSMGSVSAWAQSGPVMNEEYLVQNFRFGSWSKARILGDYFLEGAERAIVKVYNAHYIEFYYSEDQWANNAQQLEKIPYSDNGFTYIYEITDVAAARNGYYWVHTDNVDGKILSITNCDANYVAPTPGPGGNGGGDINPPGYEPDYTGQNDADDDGVLEPDDTNPAFGVKVDYNKFPQLTDIPSMYITVYKTTATDDGQGGYNYTYDATQTEDVSTTKHDWYYQCRIVIADQYGNMKQRDELVGLRGRGNSTWVWTQPAQRGEQLR